MKRLVNKRPICFAALFLGIGIFLTGMYEDAVWARVLFLAAALIFAGFVLIFKKARLLYIPIIFALGVLLLSGVIDVYKSTAVTSEKAEITGTISTEIASKNEHSYYFKIDNVTIDGEETGKQAFVVSGFLPNARAGDKVKIVGDVSTYDMGFRDFTSYGARGTKFYVKSRKIENVGQGVLSFDKRVLIKYKRLLYDNCDDMTSDTALALLFGDRFAIDSQYSHNVKDAGILHIFAVSGLHVGMLAAVTAFLARKLKKKKALYLLIVEIPLILYGWICGFGASVLRAIVMSTVFIVSGLTGRQRDSLNSLSLAAIIVLILNPTDMFTKGFHLSFAALLGLIVIVPRLTRKELSGVKKKVRDMRDKRRRKRYAVAVYGRIFRRGANAVCYFQPYHIADSAVYLYNFAGNKPVCDDITVVRRDSQRAFRGAVPDKICCAGNRFASDIERSRSGGRYVRSCISSDDIHYVPIRVFAAHKKDGVVACRMRRVRRDDTRNPFTLIKNNGILNL